MASVPERARHESQERGGGGGWSKDGPVMRALASHQCGAGLFPGVDAICGLSLLLVLILAPKGFSPGTQVLSSPEKPTLSNFNSIWNAWKHLNEFSLSCRVGKQTNNRKKEQGSRRVFLAQEHFSS